MVNKQITSHVYFLIIVICVTAIIMYSCSNGNNTGEVISVTPTCSLKYEKFLSDSRSKTPEEFIQYWNSIEYKNWQFQLYKDQYTPNSPLTWPDNSFGEDIFSSRLINCYRIGKLLEKIFPGENILISQPDNKWDHYYYKLSTGEIINNYNDGRYLYLK